MEENIVRVQSQSIEIVQEKLILNEIGRVLEDTFKHLVIKMSREFPNLSHKTNDGKIHLCDIRVDIDIQNWDICISMSAKQGKNN